MTSGGWRWKLRELTLANSSLIIIYKGEKWECHHDGREWVMSQYFVGLPLPGDRWPPEEFDLKYFWRSELFFMNQVLSHIIRRNETIGDRGAVTLRWSMRDWSELMTSRVSFYKHGISSFSTVSSCPTWLQFRIDTLKTKLYLTTQRASYLIEETRFWQVNRRIFFMPWLRETKLGCSLERDGMFDT